MKPLVIQWPSVLWLLLLLVPLAVLLARARRKRAELGARIGGGTIVAGARRDRLRLVAMGLLLLALARPGYAPERRAISQSGRDVVFAIDVSRSMLAEDAHPSRLEAAKQGVRDAVARFGSERAGLVIYAGSATTMCPLTYDYDFIRYMLEQTAPRAVDFGGTALLSAVEKSVDSLFSDQRRGMQDLVVLTDGEDHGPEMERVAALLEEKGVGLLLVGIGDADVGSRIPIENRTGGVSYLQHDGDFVSTRMNEPALRDLAGRLPDASYVGPGTAAFDLGKLYADYAEGKPVSGAAGSETFVVYQEGGLVLIAAALVLFLVAGRPGRVSPVLAVLLIGSGLPLNAAEAWMNTGFEKARQLQAAGKFIEAIEAYGELEPAMDRGGATPRQFAAMRFNQGLCHLTHAAALAGESPHGALAAAQLAQRCFLQARRMDRGMHRAGMRLDSTAALITRYARQVREREQQEQAFQEMVDALVERLRALLEKQITLRGEVRARTPANPPARRPRDRRESPPDPPRPEPTPPPTAIGDARVFVARQAGLLAEGQSIHGEMEALDKVMNPPAPGGLPPTESVMKVPLRLMTEAVDAQQEARMQLAVWSAWEAAAARQQVAIERIREILDMLEGSDSEESDDGEGENDEEDWDMEDYEDAGEGTPTSMPMQGDLAAGSKMQPLPVPNYSVDDLRKEEQGNLQFRQQQRERAQAGKVKKDW